MNFRISVGLYRRFARHGQITFHSLLVKQPSDYTCEPEGILVHDEARDLLQEIRRDPLCCQGVIGKYTWLA
jgi:hypothetical protein